MNLRGAIVTFLGLHGTVITHIRDDRWLIDFEDGRRLVMQRRQFELISPPLVCPYCGRSIPEDDRDRRKLVRDHIRRAHPGQAWSARDLVHAAANVESTPMGCSRGDPVVQSRVQRIDRA